MQGCRGGGVQGWDGLLSVMQGWDVVGPGGQTGVKCPCEAAGCCRPCYSYRPCYRPCYRPSTATPCDTTALLLLPASPPLL